MYLILILKTQKMKLLYFICLTFCCTLIKAQQIDSYEVENYYVDYKQNMDLLESIWENSNKNLSCANLYKVKFTEITQETQEILKECAQTEDQLTCQASTYNIGFLEFRELLKKILTNCIT